jgi:hypothetical protein
MQINFPQRRNVEETERGQRAVIRKGQLRWLLSACSELGAGGQCSSSAHRRRLRNPALQGPQAGLRFATHGPTASTNHTVLSPLCFLILPSHAFLLSHSIPLRPLHSLVSPVSLSLILISSRMGSWLPEAESPAQTAAGHGPQFGRVL